MQRDVSSDLLLFSWSPIRKEVVTHLRCLRLRVPLLDDLVTCDEEIFPHVEFIESLVRLAELAEVLHVLE